MRRRVALLALVAAAVVAAGALASSAALILPTHTPGVRYSAVTQKTLFKTVCRVGWTKTIRPPASYTNALKKKQLVLFQYADLNPSHFEEDHLVSSSSAALPARHGTSGPSRGRRLGEMTTGSRRVCTGDSATGR